MPPIQQSDGKGARPSREETAPESPNHCQGNLGLAAPDRLSLRARVITRLVRWAVQAWPRNDPAKLARGARRFFDLPNVLGFLCSRGMRIGSINSDRVRGEWIESRDRDRVGDGVVLYFHGGGYVSCSAKSHRSITATLARDLAARVFSVNYRLAPEHPFPAAVDDAVAAHQWLVDDGVPPTRIAFAGDSAGGGLAIAVLLRLRETGKPMPASVVCLSPWVDLTAEYAYSNSGSTSFQSSDIAGLAELYLHGASPTNPEASPVFGDLTGLPPLLILATRTELLADDAVRLHGRATSCGVNSTLLLYPDLPHVWQIYASLLPEARLALRQMGSFITENWKGCDGSK